VKISVCLQNFLPARLQYRHVCVGRGIRPWYVVEQEKNRSFFKVPNAKSISIPNTKEAKFQPIFRMDEIFAWLLPTSVTISTPKATGLPPVTQIYNEGFFSKFAICM